MQQSTGTSVLFVPYRGGGPAMRDLVAGHIDLAVRARFSDLGLDIASREQQTPEGLAAFHKAEIEKWWPIIRAAGIKVE